MHFGSVDFLFQNKTTATEIERLRCAAFPRLGARTGDDGLPLEGMLADMGTS